MRIFKIKLLLVVVLAAMLTADYSVAESKGKGGALVFSGTGSAMALPRAGVAETFELQYRYYYTDSEDLLWKNNYVGGGVSDTLSPATNSIGAFIEVQPIAAFNLRVQYDYIRYFGAFTAMVMFPGPNADYSDEVLDDLAENDQAIWAKGKHLSVQPTFQAIVGRFVLVNMLSLDWYDMEPQRFRGHGTDNPFPGHDYYYSPMDDALLKTDDFVITNQTITGVTFRKRSMSDMMLIGTRYLYKKVDSTDRVRQEVDAVFVWMMGEKLFFMEEPSLMVAAGTYIEDRYREDDIFFGGMFSFEYTLWSGKE